MTPQIEFRWLQDRRSDAVPPVLQWRELALVHTMAGEESVWTEWQTVPTVYED